jgi:hypothetical protein
MTESQDKIASSSVASLDLPIELIRRYKEDCEIRGMSPESLRRYISSLKIYNKYLQERNLDLLNVDRNVLRSFLEYLRKDSECLPKNSWELLYIDGHVLRIPGI